MKNNNRCIFHSESWIDFDKLIRGKNINFLIGSGASAISYPTLSLSSELKDMILEGEENINSKNINSFEDIITSPEISQEKKDFLYFYFYHNWIKKMFDTVDVIKKTKEKTKEENKYKYSKNLSFYIKFIQKMFIFLQNESNDRPKRMNIFTTNYDLFFELAYDKIFHSVPFGFLNDGSKGIFDKIIDIKNFYLNISHSGFNDEYRYEIPTLNLLKIHGSISWIKDEVLDNNKIKYEVLKMKEASQSHKNLKNCYDEILKEKDIKFLLKNIDQSTKEIIKLIRDNIWRLWLNKMNNPENKSKEQLEDEKLLEALSEIINDENKWKEFKEQLEHKNILKQFQQIIWNNILEQEFNKIIKDKDYKKVLREIIDDENRWEEFEKELKDKNILKQFEEIIWNYILKQKSNEIINDEDFKKELNETLLEKYKKQLEVKDLSEKFNEKSWNNILGQKLNKITNKDELNKKLKDFNEQFAQLCIINPDKNKFAQTVLQQHYYQMLRSFSYELEKTHTVLIVFGFSFKDEHIRNILERSLSNPTLTVYVLPFNNSSYNDIGELFPNYDNFKFLFCHEENNCSAKQKFNKYIQENPNKKIEGDFKFLIEGLFEFIKVEKNE